MSHTRINVLHVIELQSNLKGNMISDEYMLKAAGRMQDAADRAQAAADRMEAAAHRIALLLESSNAKADTRHE
jgi:hypothetical protein